MATVRVTLKSLGYPNIAPNMPIVLQSLVNAGYDVILRDIPYGDKNSIIDYFDKLGIPIRFASVPQPSIEIIDNKALFQIGEVKGTQDTFWRLLDKKCLALKLYRRVKAFGFTPSYKENTYFLVVDYGLPTQAIHSYPISSSSIRKKCENLIELNSETQTIDIVNSTSFLIEWTFNKERMALEPLDEPSYFSILV